MTAPQHLPPFVIMAAPNGARRTQADHPNLPVTPAALAYTAAACLEAGAAALHLHVRDRDQRHILDAEAYGEALAAIRRTVGDRLILQITTEAVGRYTAPEQQAVVRAVRPESVSVALREMVPDAAHEHAAAAFYAWCRTEAVAVQHILYDGDDVERFLRAREQGIIPSEGGTVLFVLGRYLIDRAADPNDIVPFLTNWSGELPWALCCFGNKEARASLTAALLGGHCRVGFENNLDLADGTRADGNEDLVAQVATAVTGCPAMGRTVASADEARALGF